MADVHRCGSTKYSALSQDSRWMPCIGAEKQLWRTIGNVKALVETPVLKIWGKTSHLKDIKFGTVGVLVLLVELTVTRNKRTVEKGIGTILLNHC